MSDRLQTRAEFAGMLERAALRARLLWLMATMSAAALADLVEHAEYIEGRDARARGVRP